LKRRAKKKEAMPPIPSQVFSVHGPVQVSERELEGLLGETRFDDRSVVLHSNAVPLTKWITYWHEAVHVALWDSGAHNGLTKELEETICDAIGNYLAGAVKAGHIKVMK
jgi:hypothetical protein